MRLPWPRRKRSPRADCQWRHSHRRRYRVNLIKATYPYDTNEIAKLFHIHRNTVRQWFKGGLTPIDERRPVLVRGSVLKAFLTQRQEARRQKCAPGEFFCFRCRAPQRPWDNLVDVSPHTEKIAKLTAICCVCETVMHRTIRRADLPKFAAAIEQQPMASERLRDRTDASANVTSRRATGMSKLNPQNERVKRDYLRYLREARGRNEATLDGVRKALSRFEDYTGAPRLQDLPPRAGDWFQGASERDGAANAAAKLSASPHRQSRSQP